MNASAKIIEKNGARRNTSTTVVPCLPVKNHTGPWCSQIYPGLTVKERFQAQGWSLELQNFKVTIEHLLTTYKAL
jgi:hypothetical protein